MRRLLPPREPVDGIALAQGRLRELSLELAHLLGAGPERDRHLSRHAAVGIASDHRDRDLRLDHRAGVRSGRRRDAHAAVEGGILGRFRLRRILPQHAAIGAAVPLVLRPAGTAAACLGALAEADPQRAVLHRGDRDRAVHVRARGRADARRHQRAAARPETGRDRARVDDGADLSLRAAADGVPHHHAAADVRIPQHHQEHLGGHHHRPDRTDRRGALDAGIFVPGVRGLYRRDRALSAGQYRRRHRHAPARARL